MNNLFGKSKEPFWQQAYTDLLKFVILLRRLVDGYTTFAEVYRYILEDSQDRQRHQALKATLTQPPEVIVVPLANYELQVVGDPVDELVPGRPRTHGASSTAPNWSRPCTNSRFRSKYGVRKAPHGSNGNTSWTPWTVGSRTGGVGSTSGFDHRSRKASSSSCRCSMTTRRFIGRSARHEARTLRPPKAGEPRPLAPLEELLESGHVLALNFPVGLNPGLARALGVMLKLDFQRAVLQRIPKIAAHPERTWRDLLFVCDEYHAFATVGETDPTGDERTFALSRQARLIPIVATQSISSLRSALPGDESWRTLLQCFRTKLFLATSDEFTAQSRRGSLRTSRSAEGALHPVGGRPGRAHFSAHRSGHRGEADGQRQQELRAAPRVHLLAPSVHGAAERPGDRVAVRRPQSDARRSSAT